MEEKKELPQVVQVVASRARGQINEELVNAVIAAAVHSVEQDAWTWQKMITVLHRGAEKTEKGTVNAFLFQAMVDRLVEEFRALNT